MIREPNVLLNDLIFSLSSALDLARPELVDHQQRVAYIALSIAQALGWSEEEQAVVLYAGCLHDIGLLTVADKMRARICEDTANDGHPEVGWNVLLKFRLFRQAAELVRYHHEPWAYGDGREVNGQAVAMGSHLLHLANGIEISVKREEYIINQREYICGLVEERSGSDFNPEMVEAFKKISATESFWLDLVSPQIYTVLSRQVNWPIRRISLDDMVDLTGIFSKIIDFRSPWTVTHSAGVAATAESLGRALGLSRREQQMLRVAGYLHDLGKLFVPESILNKPSGLDNHELQIMRAHVYYTFQILDPITGLEQINEWAAFHHERLNGKGYPFRHHGDDLTLGSRIMAVADMCTAIAEDRPYRKAMDKTKTIEILKECVSNNSLDRRLVEAMVDNYDSIAQFRQTAQSALPEEYSEYVKLGQGEQATGPRRDKEPICVIYSDTGKRKS